MKRAHRAKVRACSSLAGHAGAWIIGLALVSMVSLPGPAWCQSAWPSYPNNNTISVTSGGNVGVGTTAPVSPLHVVGSATQTNATFGSPDVGVLDILGLKMGSAGFATDAMGNLSQVTEPDPAGGADLVTAYSYDGLNHMTQVNMPRQGATQTRTFTYDASTQRLTAVQTPESGMATYIYNPDGTVYSKTDAKGQRTQYQYDGYQRVIETEAFPAGANQPDPCQTVTYQYDLPTVSGAPYTNGIGRLTGMYWSSPNTARQCPSTFAEEYAYTAWGQVYQKQMTVHSGREWARCRALPRPGGSQ